MVNIVLFIRRYAVFIWFVILQAICLYMLTSYNRFHHAKGLAVAGTITSYFNGKYNKMEDFFRMGEENRRVHALNDSLINLLKGNFTMTDSNKVAMRDTVQIDTAGAKRIYRWKTAQVLYTTVGSDKNYMQINKGSNDGISDDMGVFSSNGGLVGKVVNTGKDFSEVMILLHVMNKLGVKMKKTGSSGTLTWDGKSPSELALNGIAKSDSVRRGDTVLTGNYSLSYPPDKMVGTVSEVLKDKSTNFLILKIKPTANFGSLQQVFVVENTNMDALKALNEDTRKKVEAVKPGTK